MLRAAAHWILSFMLLSGAIVVGGAWLFIEAEPAITDMAAPTPEDVLVTRQFVHDVRASVGENRTAAPLVSADEAELNSVIRLGARTIPGFRGRIRVRGDDVLGEASIPIPGTGESRWLNLSATVPSFENGVVFRSASVGPVDLPPELALAMLRMGGNLALGDGLGDTITSAASAMRIDGDRLLFALAIDELGSNGVMRGVFGSLRGSEMPGPEEIERYYLLIRAAMERGDLPTQGSYLPYLHFTLNAALEGSRTERADNAYTSALLALSQVCGAADFLLVMGRGFDREMPGDGRWTTDCSALTLNGRIDSRRHFTTAAAIQAASNRGFSVSVGEFKELFDSRHGGFDFTDLAANNSGIRMSNLFMETPAEAWPALIARIGTENDVIVPYDGIPQIMSREDFSARYGTVDSPEYMRELAAIEARIDRLRLHAGP